MSLARHMAFEVLLRVEQGGAFANRALDSALSTAGVLDPREVGLTTELVYGTLRWQIAIDHALVHFGRRPVEDLDPETRAVLRLGAHQLMHLRIPPHAAVHSAVEQAKSFRRGRSVKFVNAVLRALSTHKHHLLIPPASVDAAGHLSVTQSFPRWLCERLIAERGIETARNFLEGLNRQAALTLRVQERRASRTSVLERLNAEELQAEPTDFSPVGIRLPGADAPARLLRPAEGVWQAQDEAAQLVGFFAAPRPGDTVLDACAAPGGKTCHLAELMDDTGRVDAIDVHPGKIREIGDAARKLGLTSIHPRAGDATLPVSGAPAGGYDLVLIDAPCSGLGTLRRHPELKTRRGPDDVARLAELQGRILDNLSQHVRPGGVLVYSLCTFTPDEGTLQIDRFLQRHPDFARQAPPPAGVDWTGLLDSRGDLVLEPHRHGTDAFYGARLVRRSARAHP